MIRRVLSLRPRAALLYGAGLAALIALADWRLEVNATLAFLYLFPLMLLGTVMRPWQIAAAALACTFLSDRLDPFPMEMEYARDSLIFLTLATTGLLSRGVASGYRREVANLAALTAAEQQLEFLIESSPAAVLTMDGLGTILLANPTAHRLFGVQADSLPGTSVSRFVPALGSIPSADKAGKGFRTEMQTRGQRANGEAFLADVFFSTYTTPGGPRLSALVVDVSEQLREREEAGLEQLLSSSRILVGAVSHEVRNVCGAIGMMHENLERSGMLRGNKDFEALGSLVETLSRIAAMELRQSTERGGYPAAELDDVLTDFRIVLEPICQESDIELAWKIPQKLPKVQADGHRLLQVLLNLAKNSERALAAVDRGRIEVESSVEPSRVLIHFSDNGPGIATGTPLFQPLQKGAEATGLGLYLSRAFMRSFRGDLRHDGSRPGCRFTLELRGVGDDVSPEENGSHTPVVA